MNEETLAEGVATGGNVDAPQVLMPWPLTNIIARPDVTRWLAAHDAAVRDQATAEAWDEAVDAAFRGAITRQNADDVKRHNPHRAAPSREGGRLATIRLPGAHEVSAETGMNVGTRHYLVAVDVDPTIAPRGEQRHVGNGAHVVLRELDEHADQVLLHELLHVITGHVVPPDTFGPHNHRLIAHLEVALWEAGYRRAAALPAAPPREGDQ